MALSSQQLAELAASGQSTEAPRSLSAADLVAIAQQDTPDMFESLLRGTAEGVTFGFDSNLGLDKQRREISRTANPWMHLTGELLGGIIPQVALKGVTSGVKTAAPALQAANRISPTTANVLTKGANAIEAVALPSEAKTVTQAALQGAKVGTTYGALSGAGHNEDDRLSGAVLGALYGAPIGTFLGGLTGIVSKPVQAINTARVAANAETDASKGALTTIANALERDRITPMDLRRQIANDLNQAKPTPTDPVPLPAAPLNLIDRATMVRPGAGQNTQMTMRVAANTPGEERAIASEALLSRQYGANARIHQALGKSVGNLDFEKVAEIHSTNLANTAKQLFSMAEVKEKPFNLQPIFDRFRQKYEFNTAGIPKTINSMIDGMHAKVQVQTNQGMREISVAPRNLKEFMLSRDALSDAISAAKPTATNPGQPKLYGRLVELKQALDAEVARTNPMWKVANDVYADGKMAQKMMDAGAKMSLQLGTKSREALALFSRAQQMATQAKANKDPFKAQAAQAMLDLYKVGFARALSDKVMNQGLTHDLTRALRLPSSREIFGRVLGRQEAYQLSRAINAEHAIHGTYKSQFGSQTAPLKAAMEDANWAPRFESWKQVLNPVKLVEVSAEKIARHVNAKRNKEMMGLLTSEDPQLQMSILKAVQDISRSRNSINDNITAPLLLNVAPGTQWTVGAQNRTWEKSKRPRRNSPS